MNNKPGYYPTEDLHAQNYWKVRALEWEMEEQDEHARQCAFEWDLAQREYQEEAYCETSMEWYNLNHQA